jgi:hypothetical protein
MPDDALKATEVLRRLLGEMVYIQRELEGTREELRVVIDDGHFTGHVDSESIAMLQQRIRERWSALFALHRGLQALLHPGIVSPFQWPTSP